MARVLDLQEIVPGLWLGPCPRTPEFLRIMREVHGIDAIVNVQTDADLEQLGLSWTLLWRFLMARSFAVARVPIVDFDDRSLGASLADAVAAVEDMRMQGHNVYVHCSIGVHRSPTVVVAWLVRHRGMALADAVAHVRARRPQVEPNLPVLQRWPAEVR